MPDSTISDIVLKNGFVLNVFTDEFVKTDVAIKGERIFAVCDDLHGTKEMDCSGKFILPGLIDAHIHIESTLATPCCLAKEIIKKGTTTCIADPHELVNVKGKEALKWLLKAVRNTPVDYKIMIPSSVPATDFDTNGAGHFTAKDMEEFRNDPNVLGLGEVMCFRDVLEQKGEILDKLALFKDKKIDGHAPGINALETELYTYCGVQTDHECTTFEEALQKLRAGLCILIREGSGAQNLDVIVQGMLKRRLDFSRTAFCTDDKHLEDISNLGHINHCVNKAISLGLDAITAIKTASYYPSVIYGLSNIGSVSAGKQADILICESLELIEPLMVIKKGTIADEAFFASFYDSEPSKELLNTVQFGSITSDMLAVPTHSMNHVIEVVQGQLLTNHLQEPIPSKNGLFAPSDEYSKLCVIERHGKTGNVNAAVLKGFGIHTGAIATSVSHDSHNLIIAGDNDEDIIVAANHIKSIGGGYCVVSNGKVTASLSLEIAGLISRLDAEAIKERASKIISEAQKLGVHDGIDPIINLSFMALPVIPSIRLLDTGLFDVDKFCMIED